jgi:chromosome segregation ATPase
MPTLEDLSERVERLLLRHQELKQTQALLEQQVVALIDERDVLRMRLNAARDRIDVLLGRSVLGSSAAAIQSFEPVAPEQPSSVDQP